MNNNPSRRTCANGLLRIINLHISQSDAPLILENARAFERVKFVFRSNFAACKCRFWSCTEHGENIQTTLPRTVPIRRLVPVAGERRAR